MPVTLFRTAPSASLAAAPAALALAALAAVALAALAPATALADPAMAHSAPLPRPRPVGLQAPDIPLPRPRPAILDAPEGAPGEATTSACLRALPVIAEAEPQAPLKGENGCGAADVVRLSTVIAKDGARIAVKPPATLRCSMAEAVAHWVRDDVVPAALTLGAPLAAIASFASYECRGRNRIIGAMISEHGKGNALDIRALLLANRKVIEPTDVAIAKTMRERLKASACARFTTVLGPASDGYHENHIHVDLAERRSGYRLCQWMVRDPAELVPLPRERPAEAPPRVAGQRAP